MATNGNKKENDYVVALDIGTSKVVCLIGQLTDSHAVEIVALGSYPSSGLKKGVVVNIDATTDAIQKSIDQAKNSFDGKLKNVYVGIAGNHIKSLNSHGMWNTRVPLCWHTIVLGKVTSTGSSPVLLSMAKALLNVLFVKSKKNWVWLRNRPA